MFTGVTEDKESYCIKHDYQLGRCSGSEQTETFICKVDEPAGYQRTTLMTIFRDGKSNICCFVVVYFIE